MIYKNTILRNNLFTTLKIVFFRKNRIKISTSYIKIHLTVFKYLKLSYWQSRCDSRCIFDLAVVGESSGGDLGSSAPLGPGENTSLLLDGSTKLGSKDTGSWLAEAPELLGPAWSSCWSCWRCSSSIMTSILGRARLTGPATSVSDESPWSSLADWSSAWSCSPITSDSPVKSNITHEDCNERVQATIILKY